MTEAGCRVVCVFKLFAKVLLNRDIDGPGENSAVYPSINNIFDRNPGDMQA